MCFFEIFAFETLIFRDISFSGFYFFEVLFVEIIAFEILSTYQAGLTNRKNKKCSILYLIEITTILLYKKCIFPKSHQMGLKDP